MVPARGGVRSTGKPSDAADHLADGGSFISGPITMRAELDPPTAATSVVFFADGRQLCTVSASPFECTWDAGPAIVAHQVRVVANLTGGQRVIKVVRTKGLASRRRSTSTSFRLLRPFWTVGTLRQGLPRSAFHVSRRRPAADDHAISPLKMFRWSSSWPSMSVAA